MASTIVGRFGRIYTLGEALHKRPGFPSFNLIKAESEGVSFVVKRVPAQFYDISEQPVEDVKGGDSRLCMHVNCNEEEGVHVYPYVEDTMLSLWDSTLTFLLRKG
ncbi:hypothetical protein P154DRAFT_534990 [Amniculicola lignicola CBS 123094]|uniref:Uncharacterized protein n=1 Tax=Amniculicola lignicola CBS 123094 TaxID=1392246 RepID=A0A6A5WGH0_9PLEO|nr:hypothetical protein P154DRAFT_534990 [Amniculicola lignicola CBS 123094]